MLAPMVWELRPLVRSLSLKRSGFGGPNLLRGMLGTAEIVAATTGIGTRAAARTAEWVLDLMAIDHLVVVGIAGGIAPSVDIGNVVVPSLVIDLATGAEYRPSPMGQTGPRGTLATSDEVLRDGAEIARLQRQGVVAVDMETAAIAAMCEHRRCPWSVFRAISDRADDGSTDPAVFALAGQDGSPAIFALLRFVLTNPRRVAQLARLAAGMRLATNAAASAAVTAIGKTLAI